MNSVVQVNQLWLSHIVAFLDNHEFTRYWVDSDWRGPTSDKLIFKSNVLI